MLTDPRSLIRVPARWLRSALFPLALLVTGAGAGGSQPALVPGSVDGPETGTIAIVDGEEVSLSRFNTLWEVNRKNLGLLGGHIPEPKVCAQKIRIADKLIDELLIEHAAEQEHIVVEEREADAALDARRKRFSSPDAFEKHVASLPLGLAELRHQLRLELLRERLLQRRAPKALSEEQLRLMYERYETHFRAPSHLVVQEILLRVTPTMSDDEMRAKHLQALKLREQALTPDVDFAALMKRHSETPSSGGSGATRLTPGSAPDAVWSAVSELELRQVSPVVQTKQGFHVFKLVGRGPLVRLSFDIMKGRVAAENGATVARRLARQLPEAVTRARTHQEHAG